MSVITLNMEAVGSYEILALSTKLHGTKSPGSQPDHEESGFQCGCTYGMYVCLYMHIMLLYIYCVYYVHMSIKSAFVRTTKEH